MDPLSDVLRVVRLSGAYFYPAFATGPWGLRAPAASELMPRILPGCDHLISYHVILHGSCWGGLETEPLLHLESGDVILFPQGDAHVMTSSPSGEVQLIPVREAPRFPSGIAVGDRSQPDVKLVCGFFGCDRHPFNPLCAALPRQMVMRGLSEGWVGSFARQVMEESAAGRVGTESVLTRLAELMFVELLRRYLESLPPDQEGWLAALRDPVVGRALGRLHQEPGRHWTLADLAMEAAASRSLLAERFAQLVGQPPMQYLTQWRMQLAATRLREAEAKVATVAFEVGYESEAAFGRAFKKATGVAPGEWRRHRGAEASPAVS